MPIETTNYMILGFAVTFGAIALYTISLTLRIRNLKADHQILKSAAKPAKKASFKKVSKKTAKKAAKKTAKRATRR